VDHGNGRITHDSPHALLASLPLIRVSSAQLYRRDSVKPTAKARTSAMGSRLSRELSAWVPDGTNALAKPSFAASFRRASAWAQGRTSPDKQISPNTTLSLGS